jgi:hypothetical protein
MSDDITIRQQAVAQVLGPVLAEGEEFHVRRSGSQVEVTEARVSSCREYHPQLYGQMLSLNAQIDRAGGNLFTFGMIAAAACCLGLYLEWWDEWLDLDFLWRFRNGWTYAFLLVAAFLILSRVTIGLEKWTYQRGREHLLTTMHNEGLNRDVLLALTHGDKELAKVARYLKLDRAAARFGP